MPRGGRDRDCKATIPATIQTGTVNQYGYGITKSPLVAPPAGSNQSGLTPAVEGGPHTGTDTGGGGGGGGSPGSGGGGGVWWGGPFGTVVGVRRRASAS